MLMLEGHPGPIHALAFSPDGAILASAGTGGAVQIWAPPTDLGVLNGYSDTVQALAFSPDSNHLAIGGLDRVVSVWDLRSRRRVVASGPQQHPISTLGFIGAGTVIFGIGERPDPVARPNTLFILDLATGKARGLPFGVVNGVRALAALPERKLAAWATDNKILRVQDISRPPGKANVLKNDCRTLALSADARRLAVSSDWEILLFDLERWPERPTTLGRHQGVLSALAFAPDCRTLFSGGWDNTVRVWDLDRNTERSSFTWPIGNRVNALAVGSDGLRAAVGGDSGTIVVWDLD